MNKADFTVFTLLMTVIIALQVHWLLGVAFFLASYSYISTS